MCHNDLGPWNKMSLVTQSPRMRSDVWSIASSFSADAICIIVMHTFQKLIYASTCYSMRNRIVLNSQIVSQIRLDSDWNESCK